MSFYSTYNSPIFSIKKSNRVDTAIQDNVSGLVNTSIQTIFATFQRVGDEYRINPINLNDSGYFQVTQPGPTMSVIFTTNLPYTNVIGTISYGRGYSISKPTQNQIEFEMQDADIEPLFATMSFMLN